MKFSKTAQKRKHKSPSSFMEQLERTTIDNALLLPNSQPQNRILCITLPKVPKER